MGLSRTTLGLRAQRIALDATNPFDAGEWTTSGGMTFSVDGTTGRLKITSTSSVGVWRLGRFTAAGEAPGDLRQLVQARTMRTTGSPNTSRVVVGTMDSGNDWAGARFLVVAGNSFWAYWHNGLSGGGTAGTVVADKSLDTLYLVSAFIEKDAGATEVDIDAYDHDSGTRETTTASTLISGTATWPGLVYHGSGTNTTVPIEVESFYVQNHKYLTVEGLATGAVAKLRDSGGTVLAQATEGAGGAPSGSAWVDVTETDPAERYDLRVETSGGSEVATEVSDAYLWGGDVWELVAAPADTPTVTVDEAFSQSVQVSGSAFSHSEGGSHADTQWQIDESGGDFSTPVVDQTDGAPTVGALLTGLDPETDYIVRVRYQDDAASWSDWSASAAFSTTEDSAPAKPTLTVAGTADVSADFTGSLFSSPKSSPEHIASSWQVDTSGSDFSTPVWESLDDGLNLTSVTATGLTASTNYIARVRYQDVDGEWSEWSDSVAFTTRSSAAPAGAPDTPSITADDETASTISASSSAYSHGDSTPHQRSQWQASLVSTFATVVADEVSTSDLEAHVFSGLAGNTLHYIRVRHQDTDGDWSNWSTADSTTTDVAPGFPGLTNPMGGEAITAWPFSVEWDESVNVDLAYSTDLGGVWTSIATNESGPYSWADPGLPAGVYLLRIAVTGTTDYEYAYFTVDPLAATSHVGPDGFDSSGEVNWLAAWDTTQATWGLVANPGPYVPAGIAMTTDPPQLAESGGALARWYTRWASRLYTPALQPTQADVITRFVIRSNAIGILGTWYRDAEFTYGGIAAFASGNSPAYSTVQFSTAQQFGIAIGLYTRDIWPHRNFQGREHAKGDAFLNITRLNDGGTPITVHDAALGFRISIETPNQPHDATPWYQMRTRLTTIRVNADGSRDVRVQVAIVGPDALIAGEWDVDIVVENVTRCGYCGAAARNISFSSAPAFVHFSHTTVVPLDYGECEAPPEFVPEIPEEACLPPAYDLTIFGDDDETPILGSVDEDGDIVEASFSTDGTHPRPYLKTPSSEPQIDVDPVEGRSTIGQMDIDVVDRRTDPCDNDDGALTNILATGAGFSALTGRRAVVRTRWGDGTWEWIHNGPIHTTRLLENRVTYRLTLRDIRERERDTRIFVTPNRIDHSRSCAGIASGGGLFSSLFDSENPSLDCGIEPTALIWPRGPVERYGFVGELIGGLSIQLIEETLPSPARYLSNGTDPEAGDYGVIEFLDGGNLWQMGMELIQFGDPEEVLDQDGLNLRRVWKNFGVQWRLPGEDDTMWRSLIYNQLPSTVDPTNNQFRDVSFVETLGQLIGDEAVQQILAALPVAVKVTNGGDSDLTPPAGATIEARLISLMEPSPSAPLYFDGPVFQLVKYLWDGQFSRGPLGVRYDSAVMEDLIANGPTARMIITESVEDERDWVEEHCLAPFDYVIALNSRRELMPVSVAIPDATEILPALDVTNTKRASWVNSGGDAITVVRYNYQREFIVQMIRGSNLTREEFIERYRNEARPYREIIARAADALSVDVVLQKEIPILVESEAAAIIGVSKEVEFNPTTVRTVGQALTGDPIVLGIVEYGARLAIDKALRIFDRYPFGGVMIQVDVFNTPTAVRSLTPGQWCTYDIDWIPNLETGGRGGERLGLVIAAQRTRTLLRRFTILDAGPDSSSLDPPLIGGDVS